MKYFALDFSFLNLKHFFLIYVKGHFLLEAYLMIPNTLFPTPPKVSLSLVFPEDIYRSVIFMTENRSLLKNLANGFMFNSCLINAHQVKGSHIIILCHPCL